MDSFRDLALDRSKKEFMVGAELVTTRGSANAPDSKKVAALGEALTEWDKVDWISITDNAGGNPQLEPSILGLQLREKGKDVIVNLTCKDRNRNALESTAWLYASLGLENILCLTGDYPIAGYQGIAAPVFDIDSPILLKMLSEMNAGLWAPGRKPGTVVELGATNFFLGCAVSPFKINEAELTCQYLKLELKVQAGAQFIIPQLGYEMRKSHELLIYLKQHGYDLPVFGNVYILGKTVARFFNQQMIPGCQVSDKLLEACLKAAEGPDKGKGFFLELAAKQYACFKGLGYRGAYFGGFTKIDDLVKIVEIAESYSKDDWKSFAGDVIYPEEQDFYLFDQDETSKLANPDRESPARIAGQRKVDGGEITSMYRLNQLFHFLVFAPKAPFFWLAALFYWILEKIPPLFKFAQWQERIVKTALFNCQDCGDCSLVDCYYLCPGSQCQKNQRNGPCGGSKEPLCEVEDINCIWYRAYQRAKKAGDLDDLLKRELIIRNNDLRGSSSWANYFRGRDHSVGLSTYPKKAKAAAEALEQAKAEAREKVKAAAAKKKEKNAAAPAKDKAYPEAPEKKTEAQKS